MDSALRDIMLAHRPGSVVADMGLKKLKPYLEKEHYTQEARATGDFFLKTIESKGSDDERSLASTTLKATTMPEISHEHALNLQATVLSAIAAGIMCPAAVAIANAGMKYFSKEYFVRNSDEEMAKYTISNAIVSGISVHGTQDQKAAADKIKDLDNTYWDVNSAMNISLLSDIAGGAPYSFTQYLARAGSSGLSRLCSEGSLKKGSSLVGQILDTLSAQGTTGEKAIASLGKGISLKNTDAESYYRFQKALTASIGGGGAPLASMIALYNNLMDEKSGVTYYQRESYGARVLDAIALQAPKNSAPVASAFARLARVATGDEIAAEILSSLAGRLSPQMPGSLEENLAHFSKTVSNVTMRGVGLSANAKSCVSGIFLEEMREHTDNKTIAAIADEALKSTAPQNLWQRMFTSFPSENTLKIRNQALDRIVSMAKVASLEEEMMPELEKIFSQEPRLTVL